MPKNQTPITYDTFGKLVDNGWSVYAFCTAQHCGHSAKIDITKLPGNRSCINQTYRCKCGAKCTATLTPNYD